MKKRKTYSPEQKAKAVIELLRGEKTQVEIARALGCHPNLLIKWQAKVVEETATLFANETTVAEEKAKIAELERMVGKLTIQIDFLKKISGGMD